MADVTGLGQCGSLHTLDLNYCTALADLSGFGQYGSLHTLDLSDCSELSLRALTIDEFVFAAALSNSSIVRYGQST